MKLNRKSHRGKERNFPEEERGGDRSLQKRQIREDCNRSYFSDLGEV